MSSTKKSVFQLLTGTFGVQLIALAFYPFLSRIYSPQEFGLFGVFSSFVIILGIFSTGQLHLLFPHPDKEEEAHHLYFSTIFYIAVTMVITTVLTLVFKKSLYALIGNYLYVLPISISIYSMNEISKMWFIRKKDYVQSSIFININRFTSNGLKVLFPSWLGLIISETIANFISVGFFLRRYRKDIFSSRKDFSLLILKDVFRKYWKYPTILAAGSLSQYLIWEYPIVHLGRIFNRADIGQFVLSNKLTIQTFILATGAFSLVVQNRLIDDFKNKKDISKFFLKILGFIVATTIPVIIFIHFFGQRVFEIVLSEKWSMAGQISVILSPLIFSKVLFGPFYGLFMATKKIEFLSLVRFSQFVVLLIFLNFFMPKDFMSTIRALVLIDFTSDLVAISLGIYVFKKVKKESSFVY